MTQRSRAPRHALSTWALSVHSSATSLSDPRHAAMTTLIYPATLPSDGPHLPHPRPCDWPSHDRPCRSEPKRRSVTSRTYSSQSDDTSPSRFLPVQSDMPRLAVIASSQVCVTFQPNLRFTVPCLTKVTSLINSRRSAATCPSHATRSQNQPQRRTCTSPTAALRRPESSQRTPKATIQAIASLSDMPSPFPSDFDTGQIRATSLAIPSHAAATRQFSPVSHQSDDPTFPIRSDMPCPTRVPPTATTRAMPILTTSHHSDKPSRVLPSHSDKSVRDQVVTSPTTVTCDSRPCRFATSRAEPQRRSD